MSILTVFPGQGSQFIGMGKDFYDAFEPARAVFQAVDEALKQNLSKLIFEGDLGDLQMTMNTQPAMMATSMAILETAKKSFEVDLVSKSAYLLGHSLGEYTALCAAGVLSLEDTAKLLQIRGRAMQEAVPIGEGAMAAVIGANAATLQALCKEASQGEFYCHFANDNAPGQIVISGHRQAIDRAIKLGKARAIKRIILLPVSAPFHSDLMIPAARVMKEALEVVEFLKPTCPIICNVTAQETIDPAMLKENLIAQVTGSVRWRESMLYAAEKGGNKMIEIGAGKVLTGLAKRIDTHINAKAIGTIDALENLLKEL